MPEQITLEEALELVSFYHSDDRGWRVRDVYGSVGGDVCGDVRGHVGCNVVGNVRGTINGRKWQFVETPKEKLQRLLDEVSEAELLKLINQLENND